MSIRYLWPFARVTGADPRALTMLSELGLTTIPHPPAANDIVIAASLAFSQRVCEVYQAPIEIRLQHAKPTYAFLLGFSDVRSFARAFRRWTVASPTEFRQGQPKD